MANLTYRDFQQRINIQDLLRDAGYRQNMRDGRTYPSYVRIGSDGKHVSGDKFIVTRNGMACFRPPEQKCYNVISFIKSFPELFSEYRPGMDKDRLVNLVCNRILNQPIERQWTSTGGPTKEREPFDIDQYKTVWFDKNDSSSVRLFYPYFKNRGISIDTAHAFCDHFFLATKANPNQSGKTYTNLAFPLSTPAWPGKYVLGLEERSRPNSQGKCAYKGLARNSDCTNGIWIGRLCDGCSNHGFREAFGRIKDIFWFESAYDAMAFYQLHAKDSDPDGIDYRNSAYLSTSGSPSISQFKAVLDFETDARHHLCFDNDRAGHQFAINFALTRAGHIFQSKLESEGDLIIRDFTTDKDYAIDLHSPDFDRIVERLGVEDIRNVRLLPEAPYKDWNEQLMDNIPITEALDENHGRKDGYKR